MKLKELAPGSRFPLQDNIHTVIQSRLPPTGMVLTVDKNFRMGSFDENYEPAWVDVNYTSKVPEHGKVMSMIDYTSVHDAYVLAALQGLTAGCVSQNWPQNGRSDIEFLRDKAFEIADACILQREIRKKEGTVRIRPNGSGEQAAPCP